MTQAAAQKSLLILSSAEVSETADINDAFVTKLNDLLGADLTVSWANYRDIGLELDQDSLHSFIVSTGRPLESFSAVYFKSYFRYHEQAEAIMESLQANNIPFVGSELKHYIAAYKLTQMARLSRANMPIPKTIYLPHNQYEGNYELLVERLGTPFVFKAIDGSTGDDNHLIRSFEQLQQVLDAAPNLQFIAQTCIANDSDLRFLIVGGKTQLIIKRSRTSNDTHLNNTSQGAAAELLDVTSYDPQIIALAEEAAALMDREIAGVDIMLETGTSQPYILEVNASPQIASGAFEAEKLAVYSEYYKQLLEQRHAKPLQTIGRAENIAFPELNLENVPARIDTGAKTSSIWATDITEKDGLLSYRLFAEGSEFYTNEQTTSDFEKQLVSSSTGEVQERYVVSLLVVLDGRRIRARFTLANRATQAYPVLIGRNVLSGKFLVNVKQGTPRFDLERQKEQSKKEEA